MRLALLPRHFTHLTDGHRRPRHLHRPDAASGRGSGRERRQSRRAPRRGRGRRHPGQRRGASGRAFRERGRDARSSPGRLDRDPVSSGPAIEASPWIIAPRSRRSESASLPRSRAALRVETQSRHRLRTRVRWQTCAFSRHVSSRRFAAPPRASPRPHFAPDQSPPREPFHVFSLRRTPARPPR